MEGIAMEKINKKEIVDAMSESAFISKKDASAAFDAAVQLIEKTLLEGREVNIGNFGVLTPKSRETRVGTHPKSHERIEIKGCRTVSLRLSKTFKAELNK